MESLSGKEEEDAVLSEAEEEDGNTAPAPAPEPTTPSVEQRKMNWDNGAHLPAATPRKDRVGRAPAKLSDKKSEYYEKNENVEGPLNRILRSKHQMTPTSSKKPSSAAAAGARTPQAPMDHPQEPMTKKLSGTAGQKLAMDPAFKLTLAQALEKTSKTPASSAKQSSAAAAAPTPQEPMTKKPSAVAAGQKLVPSTAFQRSLSQVLGEQNRRRGQAQATTSASAIVVQPSAENPPTPPTTSSFKPLKLTEVPEAPDELLDRFKIKNPKILREGDIFLVGDQLATVLTDGKKEGHSFTFRFLEDGLILTGFPRDKPCYWVQTFKKTKIVTKDEKELSFQYKTGEWFLPYKLLPLPKPMLLPPADNPHIIQKDDLEEKVSPGDLVAVWSESEEKYCLAIVLEVDFEEDAPFYLRYLDYHYSDNGELQEGLIWVHSLLVTGDEEQGACFMVQKAAPYKRNKRQRGGETKSDSQPKRSRGPSSKRT